MLLQRMCEQVAMLVAVKVQSRNVWLTVSVDVLSQEGSTSVSKLLLSLGLLVTWAQPKGGAPNIMKIAMALLGRPWRLLHGAGHLHVCCLAGSFVFECSGARATNL